MLPPLHRLPSPCADGVRPSLGDIPARSPRAGAARGCARGCAWVRAGLRWPHYHLQSSGVCARLCGSFTAAARTGRRCSQRSGRASLAVCASWVTWRSDGWCMSQVKCICIYTGTTQRLPTVVLAKGIHYSNTILWTLVFLCQLSLSDSYFSPHMLFGSVWFCFDTC